MKKKLFIAIGVMLLFFQSNAQLSEGGLPRSFSLPEATGIIKIPSTMLSNPDWDKEIEREKAEKNKLGRPDIVAIFTPASISYPESGTFINLEDGSKIWRAQIEIPGAPAIGLYYNNFYLPKGVKLFLTNTNHRQILGAYTAVNNQPSGMFANEAVQGSVVNVEVDIDANVDINGIKLYINRAAVYHRAIESLQQFSTIDGEGDDITTNTTSVCMINAICPQGNDYQNQRKSSIGILQPIDDTHIGFCSGTMVNNTGNTPQDCKPYYLSASHCDPYFVNDFTQSIFRFNYETTVCESSVPQTSKTLLGATLKARNVFTTEMLNNSSLIKADFMLLQLNDNIPLAWDVHFAGWDNNPSPATHEVLPKKFIGFHHPGGDYKKLSTTQDIMSVDIGSGEETQSGMHWGLVLDEGYAAEGSSGSALFNGNGLLIGMASVGGELPQPAPPASCKVNASGESVDAMNFLAYSKFAYDWDFSLDGNTSDRKLKPWLDPVNSGVTTLVGSNSQCATDSVANPTDTTHTGPSGINDVNHLNESIAVYPNPVTNGDVNITFNFERTIPLLSLEVFNVNGRSVYKKTWANVQSGINSIALDVPNGIYMMKITDGFSVINKKLVVSK